MYPSSGLWGGLGLWFQFTILSPLLFDGPQFWHPMSVCSSLHLLTPCHTCTLCPTLVFSLDPFQCGWPSKSLPHLLEEGHNHPIVRFAYPCHKIGAEFVFLSFLYIKLFELGVEVAFNNRSAVTQSIYSNSHFGAVAVSALMILLCCSFASASFTSKNTSSLSVDSLNFKYTYDLQSLIDCDPIR